MSAKAEAEITKVDAIILGAGAAGLTAAIYLGRARYKAVVIDSGTVGGQMVISYHIANYPGVAETSGYELSQTMAQQAKHFGAEIFAHAKIQKVELEGDTKRVVVDRRGIFEAPVLILATGGMPRKLGMESEERLGGHGISYCATCDGDFFTDLPIAVIGGGNSALEEAVSLTKYASKVTIIHEFDHFQAQPWAVEEAQKNPKIEFLTNQRVLDFEGEENLAFVKSQDKATGEITRTPAEGCFVFIGYVARVPEGLPLALSERGEVLTDEAMATNIPGVFAAGDLRQKRYRQVTTAVSDGTIAALSAQGLLDELARQS